MMLEELAGQVLKAKLEGREHITLHRNEVAMLYQALGWDQRHMPRSMDVSMLDIQRWRRQFLPDQVDKA